MAHDELVARMVGLAGMASGWPTGRPVATTGRSYPPPPAVAQLGSMITATVAVCPSSVRYGWWLARADVDLVVADLTDGRRAADVDDDLRWWMAYAGTAVALLTQASPAWMHQRSVPAYRRRASAPRLRWWYGWGYRRSGGRSPDFIVAGPRLHDAGPAPHEAGRLPSACTVGVRRKYGDVRGGGSRSY